MPSFELSGLEVAFLEALALIALACALVPLSRRLGLGTVIGYLAAGVVAGAVLSLSFAEHPGELLHFAEFGVVLFLFVIGLEFRPARLWELRGTIFGRGLAQVLACGAVLALPPLLFGLDWRASVIVGLGLALSSTALVMQGIDERGERRSSYGQTAISVLLFEDLAIVPLLLLVTALAPTGAEASMAGNAAAVGVGIAAIALLILAGRYGLDPMFRVLARTRTPEIMTASALGVVIAASLLMALAGVSYAMGAFIAGVMLAESSYRHEIEADIEPFRALFLGLFFVAVGLSLDLEAVAANWLLILIAVPLLVTLKSLTIYAVARLFRSTHETAVRLALGMSQHGEFGFVLFAAAASAGILDPATSSTVVTIVTLSMALSSQSDRALGLFLRRGDRETIEEDFADAVGAVLIVGFGRFGQLVAQPLIAEGLSVTLIDFDADRIREAGRFGTRVHFGDGTRREVLRAAGADEARLIAVCVDDPGTADRIVDVAKREFPHLRTLVRAFDRIHAIRLMNAGADAVVRETAASALRLGAEALSALGYSAVDAAGVIESVRARDEARLKEQAVAASGARDRAAAVAAILPEPLTRIR
ncbi:MAG TPA: monovalent cation:proton antiporter-2 (CPA2) family protein [Thermoleophilaceae bacterium]|nr:monovalent cation:proton antiporter-2 (CPA2) family protein [Thermoleophilaceae bacterium]